MERTWTYVEDGLPEEDRELEIALSGPRGEWVGYGLYWGPDLCSSPTGMWFDSGERVEPEGALRVYAWRPLADPPPRRKRYCPILRTVPRKMTS
jgi:hypothetical protein